MCDFCNEIFDIEKMSCAWWGNKTKRTPEQVREGEKELDRLNRWANKHNMLYKTYIGEMDGQFTIFAEADENEGTVENVKFCPYCGKRLDGVVDETHMSPSENRAYWGTYS